MCQQKILNPLHRPKTLSYLLLPFVLIKTFFEASQRKRYQNQVTNMESIDNAITLNNEGVSLLQSGNDHAAVAALTRSLGIIRVHLNDASRRSAASHHQQLQAPFHNFVPLPDLEDESYFIANQAITVKPGTYLDSADAINTFSGCTIMNLALAYHRRGQLGNEACMQKAETLYTMATKLFNGRTILTGTALVVRLAATNNLCHVRYERGDFELAKQELDCVAFLFRNPDIESALMSGIVFNALLLKSPSVAPAA